jgi:hypothetical protein
MIIVPFNNIPKHEGFSPISSFFSNMAKKQKLVKGFLFINTYKFIDVE